MKLLDWVVLSGTLILIVTYGVWKTRGTKNIEGYFRGDNSMRWWMMGLSIMATQASAITFLSTPGQAYEDGMRFIQFYFGLPIAMVILSVTAIPIYYRLKVYTAYEYLESRFDIKTRVLAALLFLIQRGLAAGITIYAPAIVLSTVLGWSLNITILIIGALVIIYTVSGGTNAVTQTQKQQMAVMMGGMVLAGILIIYMLPDNVGFMDAVNVAGDMGRMNIVDFDLNFENRYNFWSGITGGLFLALSYFGTDQSQVQRYLGGKSIAESRLSLLFNGIMKIPMQFIILFVGVLVFVFYQFEQPPLYFNEAARLKVVNSEYADDLTMLEQQHTDLFNRQEQLVNQLVAARKAGNSDKILQYKEELKKAKEKSKELRAEVVKLVNQAAPNAETKDTDYVFISFILKYMPTGVVGLLLAMIFSAAMSSTASELNALASTTVIDLYKRAAKKEHSEKHYLIASKGFTILWGLLALMFAAFASLVDNLIEAVNILGSLFYGTILGIFLVAFYFKKIKGNSVFIAALFAEAIVLIFHYLNTIGKITIGYLWYNVIGCVLVMVLGFLFESLFPDSSKKADI